MAADKRTPEQQAALYDYYLITRDAEYPALAKQVADLEAERAAIRARGAVPPSRRRRARKGGR